MLSAGWRCPRFSAVLTTAPFIVKSMEDFPGFLITVTVTLSYFLTLFFPLVISKTMNPGITVHFRFNA